MLTPTLNLGLVQLRWYGIIIAVAIWVALLFAERRALRKGVSGDSFWAASLWILVGGLAGGRAYHVLSAWEYYHSNPSQIVAVWGGGLGIYGAIMAGWLAFTLFWFLRVKNSPAKHSLAYFSWLDVAAPALLLGQAIGRWGNFFNYELYGWPTDVAWGLYVPPQYRLWGVAAFETFHPIFLYESVWCLVALAFLLETERRFHAHLIDGELFFLYLILYAIGRFSLEGLRIQSWTLGGWRVAQLVSLLVVAVSLVALVVRRRFFNTKFGQPTL